MDVPDLEDARARLFALLQQKAFERRNTKLSAGGESDYYFDCKQVTLDAEGAVLVGRLLFARVQAYRSETGRAVGGVGGLTLGADPIATSVAFASALADRPVPGFIVRKEPKGHGTGAYLEGVGNLASGAELVVVEDVVTTGSSARKAIARVREAGFICRHAVALVDRLEGGRERLDAEGVTLDALFTRDDFVPASPVAPTPSSRA